MEDKFIKTIGIITITIVIIFIGFMVYEFFDMLHDHYCYELPPQEFYQEPKCKEYWESK